MLLYQKFRNSSLDISPLGITYGAETSKNVYTPAGARILGWCDNGIHFCQVTGFGDYVFAVDPAATPGDCVHPVAKSLLDFIELMRQCKDVSLIAGSYQWSRSLFQKKVAAVPVGMKTRSILRALENTYHPPAIRDVYSYIHDLQASFDYRVLPLHPDYFEWCPIRPGTPKWDVGFGTPFADYCEASKAGKEMALNRTFRWNGENWCVPAIYLCENGIVVDSYLEVSGAQISAFMDKWSKKTNLSIEQQMMRTLDNPLSVEATGALSVNGKPTPLRKSYTLYWNPEMENGWHQRRVLEHYGLDMEKGYLIRRECFLRKGKNPPIRNMELCLSAAPVQVPGDRFIAPKAGESVKFTHPTTGLPHELTVIAQTREALDPNFLSNHPCCYTRLTFSLMPPINADLFRVVDCDPGDPYDGSIPDPGKTPSAGHFATSSLRYTPAEQITWRMIFKKALRKDMHINLLP